MILLVTGSLSNGIWLHNIKNSARIARNVLKFEIFKSTHSQDARRTEIESHRKRKQ